MVLVVLVVVVVVVEVSVAVVFVVVWQPKAKRRKRVVIRRAAFFIHFPFRNGMVTANSIPLPCRRNASP